MNENEPLKTEFSSTWRNLILVNWEIQNNDILANFNETNVNKTNFNYQQVISF